MPAKATIADVALALASAIDVLLSAVTGSDARLATATIADAMTAGFGRLTLLMPQVSGTTAVSAGDATMASATSGES